ncbi:hypothetical protein ABZP36_027173 [Zizania latifolia]
MGCVCGRPDAVDDGRCGATPPPAEKLSAAGVAMARREEEARKQARAVAGGREDALERRRAAAMAMAACRVRSPVPRAVEGEQVAAGWPPWLVAVAAEAVRGWVPRRAESFEKLDKIGQGTYSNVYRARDLEKEKIVALKKVEQLHKIFKLCGSPSEDYWRKSKLPHATIFKPQHPYARRVSETFKDFPLPAVALVDVLLSIDPADRGTASSALQSEFFATKPYACNPSSLPRYPPSKEFDAKRREEEARRQGIAGGKQHKYDPERRTRTSRAVPAPDANAELVSSLQKRQAQVNAKSRSEMFNPSKEDSASGFPIEPPRPPHVESSQDPQRVYSTRTFHSGPLVNQNNSSKSGRTKNGELHVSGGVNPSDFPVVVSAKSNIHSDDGNETVVTQAEAFPHGRRLSESINEHFSSSGKYDQVFQQKDESRVDGAIGYGSKGNKIHHSGPLICPSGNVDQMLKENDRQIQEVFRRTRVEKSRARRGHGHSGDGHHQFGLRPSDFGAAPVYPSSRSSYRAVQQ